jgi:hypothetical protein
MEAKTHSFLIFILAEGERSASNLGHLTPGGNSLPYALDRRLDGPLDLSDYREKTKKYLLRTKNRTPVLWLPSSQPNLYTD